MICARFLFVQIKLRGQDKHTARALAAVTAARPLQSSPLTATGKRREQLEESRKRIREYAKTRKRSVIDENIKQRDHKDTAAAAKKRARKEASHKRALEEQEEQKKQNDHDRRRERAWALENCRRPKATQAAEKARKEAARRAKERDQRKQRRAEKGKA